MPKPSYINSYQPNTALGAGLQNIAAAFFGAKQSQAQAEQDAQEMAMKENYYGANAEQSRASARKAIAESLGLENQNYNMGNMPQAIQAGGGNSEQIAKALQQIAESEQYAKAATDPTLIPNFGKLQAASGGKALYDNGLNNTTFGLFDGAVLNETNDLNQSAIKYGNDGSEIGKSKIKVDNSVINLNGLKGKTEQAQAGKYGAETDKAKAETSKTKTEETRGKLVGSFTGLNADGSENYQYVPQVAGGVFKKNGTKKDAKITTAQETQNTIQLTQKLFGVDLESATRVVADASTELHNTGDVTSALQNSFNRLSGGKELVSNDDGGFFGTDTKSLPKAQVKLPVTPQAKAVRPEGYSDSNLISEANAAITNGAEVNVVKQRLLDIGVGI